MAATIVGNPGHREPARRRCSHVRFDPDFDRHADRGLLAKQAVADIEGGIDQVESLNEDRVLRSLLRLVTATLRTNYFQAAPRTAGPPRLALKLDPRSIPDLPLPRPMFEIFVYSPASRACTCAAGRSPAAGCAGRTGRRTSAPRSSGWRRRRR